MAEFFALILKNFNTSVCASSVNYQVLNSTSCLFCYIGNASFQPFAGVEYGGYDAKNDQGFGASCCCCATKKGAFRR
jgi:hypothetical protein